MPGTGRRKVGIVLLNWNNYADTARCLLSLKAVVYPGHRIFLVDNASTDGSRERLESELRSGEVSVLLNKENLGFSRGCNTGIQAAIAEHCDYVLLLNNDCIVPSADFLDRAVEFAEARADCGIVGGKILYWPNTQRIWSVGGEITLFGREKYIGYGEVDRGQHEIARKRGFISGALMLIKREVFSRVGLLPGVYFFGREDWEFSRRAARAGFSLWYVPDFAVYHEASHSHASANAMYIYNSILSKILYMKRNRPWMFFRLWFAMYQLYVIVLFPIKYRLEKALFLSGADPETIRFAMQRAIRDAKQTEAITLEMLASYRAKYCSVVEK